MYQKILVALDNSETDRAMFPHIAELAKLHGSRLLLVHVADGWAARYYDLLNLAPSEEMEEDRTYLETAAASLRAQGIEVMARLALGDPATGILNAASEENCDLIAMTTHGQGGLQRLGMGSVIASVLGTSKVSLLIMQPQQ